LTEIAYVVSGLRPENDAVRSDAKAERWTVIAVGAARPPGVPPVVGGSTVTLRCARTVVSSSTVADVAVGLTSAFDTHWTAQPSPAVRPGFVGAGGGGASFGPAAVAVAASDAASAVPTRRPSRRGTSVVIVAIGVPFGFGVLRRRLRRSR
jgi:hypothetical protein